MKRIGALLITLCMICTMFLGCEETVVTGIYPPIAADDCEGMMYEEVAAEFEAAGFTNIEYEIIDDLITGWLTKDGEVEKVSLDGNDDFETDDVFDESASLIISYHTFPIKDETKPVETEPPVIDTQVPETEAPKPETQAPETEPPKQETQAPETEPPKQETQAPETEAPKPETQAPETEAPKQETQAPETEPPKPETQAPETEAPKQETQAPETEPPETTPVIVAPTIPENSTFSIHFIDVGQADAALVECDGHYMLIDGGNKGDSNVIYSVLKSAKVSKLDIVVATHAHEDHVGGIPGAYNYTTADLTLCPVTSYDTEAFKDFKKYADSKGGGITIPSVGDKYTLGSATIEIIGVNSTSDANSCSIVLMITYGDTKFLFTGDAEREAEQVILDSGTALAADVLKVGHHGSENSTTYPFLREIMPKYAVISVGEDNSYGHPTDNTLSRLRDADVKVFRTDMQGDIYCTSDGKTVKMSVEKNANADTLTNPVKVVETKPVETEAPKDDPVQPSVGTDYVLNTNTKKFHYPSCSSVKRMSEKNKAFYNGTREEVIAMGYDPCGNCHP